mmetsp:Transcript_59513/g.138624  ORF Transcript_59513/g.138624 Transcript_59513/m.138624 type:complete len:126 (-) Transcript_59513:498-875(-)
MHMLVLDCTSMNARVPVCVGWGVAFVLVWSGICLQRSLWRMGSAVGSGEGLTKSLLVNLITKWWNPHRNYTSEGVERLTLCCGASSTTASVGTGSGAWCRWDCLCTGSPPAILATHPLRLSSSSS